MIETRYDFKKIEEKIIKKWLPLLKIQHKKGSKDIVFLMAPPNITGSLHLGHSLENTLIDILVRYHRMKGDNPVWLPGIDHAGIATQNVVEKKLRNQGVSRFDLGKEKFIEKCWEWKEKYGNIILEQFKKLGITPDWSRVKFTMDKKYVKEVEMVFIKYYKKGFVYRDLRPINFCPRCKTGLSDLEIKWEPQNGKLYFINYLLKTQNSNFKTITIATTRPETMLGDTAVAVNPKDGRYKNFIGKTAILPIVKREIPIVTDIRVEPNFGTGVLKITPAHSLIDYEISKRQNIEIIQVIDENGKIINSKKYNGFDYLSARKKILEELEKENLIQKIEDYKNEVPYCDRCKTEIQVIPSLEWFVKMKDLAKIAIQSVKSKETEIIPSRYKKLYFDWLKNVQDWCISRKLWWGQALPVWFCKNQTGSADFQANNKNLNSNFIVSLTQPKKCPFCKKCEMVRTEEVFDTWFSSALWSFATLYTPQEKKWFPAFMVSSARDILHLWITRMIFSGLFFKKKSPYKIVFIHPTIQTKEGKRMSKSLGTGINPLDLIEKYGADALRFGLIWQMSNNQDLKFDEMHILAGKKFATKVWNATRFCVLQTQNRAISNFKSSIFKQNSNSKKTNSKYTHSDLSDNDKKIIKSHNEALEYIEKKISEFGFAKALQKIYKFFWNDLCDNYLETCKGEIKNNPDVLRKVIESSLKIINIFMPFFTEELWANINESKKSDKKLLLFEKWTTAL